MSHSGCINMYRKDGKAIIVDRSQIAIMKEAGYVLSLDEIVKADEQGAADQVKRQIAQAGKAGTDKVQNALK